MNIFKKILLAVCMLPLGVSALLGQAKKPTVMVLPGDAWCSANGYMQEHIDQGQTLRIPDYERAFQEDMDLNNVVTKIGELMAERGFPLKDAAGMVRNIRQNAAEDAMTTSRASGAALSETPLDMLLKRAKADIIIELNWQVNKTGPKQSVTYSLKGLDAYTNKQVAAAQGTGAPSFSAELPVLLEEAAIEHMDQFQSQLQSHFDDMVENGREIAFNVRVFDNGSGLSLEDEYDGEELVDIIDSWMAQNTVRHRYSLSDATEDWAYFEQVRIPLYRENGTAMDARAFANQLRKFLGNTPYNITSKILTKGLGRADLVLGEK